MILSANDENGFEHKFIVKYQYDIIENISNINLNDTNIDIQIKEKKYITKCLITELFDLDKQKSSITHIGYSYCNSEDKYDKHIGKYIASIRAIMSIYHGTHDLFIGLIYEHPHLNRIEIKKKLEKIDIL
jgi:hypothetical protein